MKKINQAGFSIVEAFLILIVVSILGFTGWYVYHAKQTSDKNYSATNSSTTPTYKKKTATAVNPYTGWNTCDDTADGVSFKYPSTWTVRGAVQSADPCSGFTLASSQEIALESPSSSGLAFTLQYFSALSKTDISKNNNGALGDLQKVQSVSSLTLSNGKTASLVSYVDTNIAGNTDGFISTMGLANQSYTVGKTFHSFSGITSPKNSSYSVSIQASLTPPGAQALHMYTPAQYQAQAHYDDLVNILKSVTY
ncbi:MAG TPA: hypothetical protein VLG92_02140 [Candidatus Saccharimonadia bacterium]|nr:hypothetical protein [Candidatus Saccharimonadia bacterium]